MKIGIRQSALSLTVFVVVLAGLVSVDERVRERFTELINGNDSLTPWGDRLGDLGGALMSAIRTQSIENAPLVIFAIAALILVAWMTRT